MLLRSTAIAFGICLSLAAGQAFAASAPPKDGVAKPAAAAPAAKKLYDRLGGKEAIKAVVDEFVAQCGADKRINSYFTGLASDPARMAKFKGNLVDQICAASGGPCKYAGKSMKDAHHGMGIADAHFTATVEDLTKALDKFKVPAKEKGELLAILGPLKKDIVEKK